MPVLVRPPDAASTRRREEVPQEVRREVRRPHAAQEPHEVRPVVLRREAVPREEELHLEAVARHQMASVRHVERQLHVVPVRQEREERQHLARVVCHHSSNHYPFVLAVIYLSIYLSISLLEGALVNCVCAITTPTPPPLPLLVSLSCGFLPPLPRATTRINNTNHPSIPVP